MFGYAATASDDVDMEEEMRARKLQNQVNKGKRNNAATEQKMFTWWSNFQSTYSRLDKAMNAESICANNKELRNQISAVQNLLIRTRQEWDVKDKELKELQELLVNEQGSAKGMSKTAAVCKDLQEY